MIKNKIIPICLLFFLFWVFSQKVCAIAFEKTVSPIVQSSWFQSVFLDDETVSQSIRANFEQNDRNVKITFSNLPEKNQDEKYFLILKNFMQGSEISATLDENFSCNLMVDYFYDAVDVFLYKGVEINDAQKQENLVCKTKTNMAHDCAYYRGVKSSGGGWSITPLNEKNNRIVTMPYGEFFARNTNNMYYIKPKAVAVNRHELFAVIEVNDADKKFMDGYRKIIPVNFKSDDNYDYGFNFYLPVEIKEFNFVVYRKNISDSTMRYKYKINLKNS